MSEFVAVGLLALQTLTTVPAESVLVARRDSLTRRIEALTEADERRWPRRATDTVRSGPLRAVVPHLLVDHTRAELDRIAVEWTRLGGDSEGAMLTVQGRDRGRTFPLQVVIADRMDPRTPVTVQVALDRLDRLPTPRQLRLGLWEGLGGLLHRRADSSLAGWAGYPILPRPDLFDADDVAYQIATTRGSASRSCLGGSGRCAEALGMAGPTTADEMTSMLRRAVLAEALERGGPGAWSRLLAGAGQPIVRRVEDLAGEPVDRLVARWQSRVGAERQEKSAGDPARWTIALGWAIAALIVTVGRGARGEAPR